MSKVTDHLLEAKVWDEELTYGKRTGGPELENKLWLFKECKPINRKLKSTFPEKPNIASNTVYTSSEGIPRITLTRVSWKSDR